ncbi:MAG: response regulator [Roseateles sp.]|uniref:response regulator n=1 Tax=Roseateles sp. TaxID=1971397 RepID=UPI00403516BA
MNRPELLLVDDDPVAIEMLSHMLAGFARLRFARTGPEALRLVRERCPDLMLLDAEMPGMHGIEVLQALRADAKLCRLPVIVITSHRSAVLEASMFENGAADFLPKPLTAPQVIARVQAQLRIQRIAELADRMPPAFAARSGASLLVVDDDLSAIQTLQSVLAPLVGQIRFATDGSQALKLIAQDPPDLVLLDVQMPGIDGFEVCRAIQADPVLRQIPVAMLTRFSDAENEARGLDSGATDFIAKPYQKAVLVARVRNLLRIKQENDQALRALSEHWQRLGAARVTDIVAAASDAIVSLDSDGRVVLINTSACSLFGVSSDAVLGLPASASLHGASGLMAWLALHGGSPASEHRATAKTEIVALVKADGTQCLLEPTSFRVGEDEAAITTLLLRDVTAREQALEAALAHQAAEAASRTKSMMLSYIAHEIGNPLNGILGYGQLMASDAAHPLDEVQAKRLNSLLTSGWHLQSLMRDVMDLSRIEAGKFAMTLASVDAAIAAKAAMDATTGQAELARISMRAALPDVPVCASADPGRLHQCLVNLLSNAIKYNQPGGSVSLTVTAEEGTVCFAVLDTGLGMTAEQCAHLFEPFNRLGRGEGDIRGAGLGLVISRLLAEAMGGALSVESHPGKGSCFTLRLSQVRRQAI